MALSFEGTEYTTIADVSKRTKRSVKSIEKYIKSGQLSAPPAVTHGARRFRHFPDNWFRQNASFLASLQSDQGTTPKPLEKDTSIPVIPEQGPSAKFTISDGEIVNIQSQFVSEADHDYQKIEAMISIARPLADQVIAKFSQTDAYGSMATYLSLYKEIVSKPAQEIDFSRLFGVGLILETALEELNAGIASGRIPDMDFDQVMPLRALLDVHGPLVSSSSDGQELITLSERYQRSPQEEAQIMFETNELITKLVDSDDILSEDTKAFLTDHFLNKSKNDLGSREYNFRRGAVRNLLIVLTAGSVVAGAAAIPYVGAVVAASLGLITLEAVKKSDTFKDLTDPTRLMIDRVKNFSEETIEPNLAQKLSQVRAFLFDNIELVQRVAGQRPETKWLRQAISWVPRNPKTVSDTSSRPKRNLYIIPNIDSMRAEIGATTNRLASASNVSTATLRRVLQEIPTQATTCERIINGLRKLGHPTASYDQIRT